MIKINLMSEDYDSKGIIRGNLNILRGRRLRERLERVPVIENSIMDCKGLAVRIVDVYSDCEGRIFMEPNNGVLYPIELSFRYMKEESFPEISSINMGAEIPNAALKTIDTSVRAYNSTYNPKIPDRKKEKPVIQKLERVLILQA